MTIALLVPSRGRPEQLKRMIQSVKDTASYGIKLYLGLSEEDSKIYDKTDVGDISIFQDNMPTVQKWNFLAEKAMKDIVNTHFMLASDDMIFATSVWDIALKEHYFNLQNKIHCYHLQDSRDKDGTPHPIVTREWIEAMGYAFPPIFLHWHLDSWTVEIAKANNCFTHLEDYLLIHDKPSDKGLADETHNRIREFGWRERDKYVNDKCQHFLTYEKNRLAEKMR